MKLGGDGAPGRRPGPHPGGQALRCWSCRWWRAEPSGNLGECTLFQRRPEGATHPDARLIVRLTGDRPGRATVTTYRDFGCVQHSPGPRQE